MKKYTYRLTVALVLLTAVYLQAGGGPIPEKQIEMKPEPGFEVPGVEVIVTRMEQAQTENRAQSCSYTVTRDYKVFGKKMDATKAHVIAVVNYIPPNLKRYAIRKTAGSAVGVTMIRKVLDKESQLAKDSSLTYISRENYDFRFSGEEVVSGHRCYVLELIPKRKNFNLIQGKIAVNAESYMIERVEGKPVVSPSWWVRDITILLHYGDVNGMWLLTASELGVKVRILGRLTMTMVASDAIYKLADGQPPPAGP
jgi:hypothetical protein